MPREIGSRHCPCVFTPVVAKHWKWFLLDCLSVGVDRMQLNFEPMRLNLRESPDNKTSAIDTPQANGWTTPRTSQTRICKSYTEGMTARWLVVTRIIIVEGSGGGGGSRTIPPY